jgi:phosphatidylserine synthase
MFIQLIGPVFEGKKGFLDVSVVLWPLIILGILSFLAYSKLKTEQPSEVDIKKQSNMGNFIVVILIILFAIFLTIK